MCGVGSVWSVSVEEYDGGATPVCIARHCYNQC